MALAALKQELEVWDSALEAYDSKDYDGALSIFEVRRCAALFPVLILNTFTVLR
jgi:hypothetical protein